MLTEFQLYQYFDSHNLSPDAREYIVSSRNSEPSRMVGTHAHTNLCSWFYSEKMKRTISTESRTAERAFVVSSEFDANVLEIWDQPEPIIVDRHTRAGHLRRGSYTPDFLILRKDGPLIVEVKDADTAKKLSSTTSDWQLREDGTYSYLPADRSFKTVGLEFSVFVASHSQRFRLFNQELLLHVRASDTSRIKEQDLDRLFEESFFWSLHDLRDRLTLVDYTGLIQCIDEEALFFNWDEEMLSEPRGCYVVRRKELLHYVSQFKGPKIYQDNLLSPIEVERVPPTRYAEEALARLERIESGDCSRSVRRWRSMIEQGVKKGFSEFQSLIPRWFISGNRHRKINSVVQAFLMRYLLEDHATSPGMTQYRSYIRYRVKAQEEHPAYPPVGMTTFTRKLRCMAEKIALTREGKRRANAISSPSDPQRRQLKAELAWQRAAIDHYLADVYLVFFDSDERARVMKPWLTAMVDLATGCTLAFSISFQVPSRMSVAKVMRDCARRHGKVPREIVVDRGTDFRSVYFSALLAHSKIELVMRPASHSRYGGEVESLFGEFKKQWLSQRPGNTADYKNARSVDGKLRPEALAVLTPYDFYREIEAFIAWRDSCPRGTWLNSPRSILARHMREFPFVGIKQDYNDEYALATAVDAKDYQLDFQRGIHIGGMWYWTPDLAALRGKKSTLEVRKDPENPHVVYGLVSGRWIPCYSSKINRFSALDRISQWVDGLIVLDAFSARQKVKQQADEEVVRIIRDMTTSSHLEGKSRVAILPAPEGLQEVGEDSVFQLLKIADIQSLETEGWEVRHVWDN